MVLPEVTYRCRHCGQLLPFDADTRVPDACLRRCRGGCDWVAVGATDPVVRARAALDGPLDAQGLPTGHGDG